MRMQHVTMATGFLFFAVETIALAQVPQIFDGQSILCQHPIGEQHRAICGNLDLRSLDHIEVVEFLRVLEYYRTRDIVPYNDTIYQQNGYINQRGKCLANIECLRAGYKARIKQLQEIHTEAK